MIRLHIVEEYGYQDWLAELTEEEYKELCRRWCTMRGLNCLVPVPLIVPQAKQIDYIINFYDKTVKRCHIHEYDDSYLWNCPYEIPADEDFWIDGVQYTHDQLFLMNNPRPI